MAKRKQAQRPQQRHKIDGGQVCRICGQPMQRYEHMPGWQPKAGVSYWFLFWDHCEPCGRVQHYEDAKVWAGSRPPPARSTGSQDPLPHNVPAVAVGDGGSCPVCGGTMRRMNHGPGWAPKPGSKTWFPWWDRCAPCGRNHFYKGVSVAVSPDAPHAGDIAGI